MNRARIAYRVRQLLNAVHARPEREDLALARTVLGPQPMELFLKMQPEEQLHSLQVYRQVAARLELAPIEESDDLLVAALLHDVGKTRYPLSLWERVVIVLGKAVAPAVVKTLGEMDGMQPEAIPFWRRSFIVAAQHARWGAEMAALAEVSPLAVNLILRHQDAITGDLVSLEDRLLRVLQMVDDQM